MLVAVSFIRKIVAKYLFLQENGQWLGLDNRFVLHDVFAIFSRIANLYLIITKQQGTYFKNKSSISGDLDIQMFIEKSE